MARSGVLVEPGKPRTAFFWKAVKSQIQSGFFGVIPILALGLMLVACDPGRTQSIFVDLDSRTDGIGSGKDVRLDSVGEILSSIDGIAEQNGFIAREDRRQEQLRFYPDTVRYYVREKDRGLGKITLQIHHDSDQDELAVYLTEFPSGKNSQVAGRTYVSLTNYFGSGFQFSTKRRR